MSEPLRYSIDRVQLLSRADQLVSAEHESDWLRHRADGCAEAIMRFLDLGPQLDLQGEAQHAHGEIENPPR